MEQKFLKGELIRANSFMHEVGTSSNGYPCIKFFILLHVTDINKANHTQKQFKLQISKRLSDAIIIQKTTALKKY